MLHLKSNLTVALLLLTLFALGSDAWSVELSLHPAASALWAGGDAMATMGDLIVTAFPNGLRLHRRLAGDKIALIGQLDIPGGVPDFVLRDSLVYGLDGSGHLFIASISTPTAPVVLGAFGPDHPWTALAMSGSHLVTAGPDSAISFALSDPVHPARAGGRNYTGPALTLATHDSVVVIAQGVSGLLLAIRHPDGTMSAKGHLDGVTIGEVVTDGNYAWSPQGDDGILVVDLTNPSAPSVLTRISTYGHADHIALAGDRLLVADSRLGLISYRLITRPLPFWQAELNGFLGLNKLWAESSSRFWAIQAGEFLSIDVHPLGNPVLGPYFGHRGGFGPVLRYRDWVYVADSTALWRIDGASNLDDSALLRISARGVYGAALSEDRLIAAEGRSGSGLYRITEDGYLETLSRIRAEHFAGGIAIGRDTLMVLDDQSGFLIYDCTNPFAPRFLGGRPVDGLPPAGAILQKYLYLSEPEAGVAVWNWEHYAKPEKIRYLTNTYSAQALLIDGDRLYVADPDFGLTIFSLASHSNPSVLGSIPLPFSPTAFCRSGRLLYVGESDGGVAAVDVADPTSPTILAQTSLPVGVIGIAKYGERLFVTTQSALHTVDVGPLLPGDLNADGKIDIFDILQLIDYSFRNGAPLYRPNTADVNGDGQVNLIDIVRMIGFVFSGGPDLVPGHLE